jgi:excisionase family DNA binding protein
MSGPVGIQPAESSNAAAELAEPLLTIREVAAFLKVNERTVRRWVVREGLPCIHLGTRLRFSQRNVLRWVSAREEGRGIAETS